VALKHDGSAAQDAHPRQAVDRVGSGLSGGAGSSC